MPSQEDFVNAHVFVVDEMRKRGLEHRVLDKLDELSEKFETKGSEWVYLEDILKASPDRIVLDDPAWSWIGSMVISGRGHDADIHYGGNMLSKRGIEAFLFRLNSALIPRIGQPVHPVIEPGHPFTSYLPAYRLVFEKIKERDIIAEQRAASPEILKQAEQSKKEDKIKMNRFFLAMKPTKAVYPEEAQSVENLARFFKDEDYPLILNKKYDGIRMLVFKDDSKILIMSEDGEDNTKAFPQAVKEFARLNVKNCILDSEVEAWSAEGHLPREFVAGQVHREDEADDSNLVFNVFDILFYNGEDLHKKTQDERLKILNKIKFPQSTMEKPNLKYRLNLVPNLLVKDRDELIEKVKLVCKKPGSEGVVVKKLDSIYYLDINSRNGWFKYHETCLIYGEVIERIPTKVPTTYNYRYGIELGKYEAKPGDLSEVRNREILEVGKSFSTDTKVERGKIIIIEAEQVNFIEDEKTGTIKVTAWAPRFLGKAERNQPDDVAKVIKRAKKNGVLMHKIIHSDGTIKYLIKEALKVREANFNFFLQEARKVRKKRPQDYPKYWAVLQNHYRGKSVSSFTPVIIREKKTERVSVLPISNLFSGEEAGLKEKMLKNLEVWGRNGWEELRCVMRHKLNDTPIYRLNCYGGVIDVTADHSLFSAEGEEISVQDLQIGNSIELGEIPNLEEKFSVPKDYAWVLGFFAAEGSWKKGRPEAKFDNNDKELITKLKNFAESRGLPFGIGNQGRTFYLGGLASVWAQFYARAPHRFNQRKARLKIVPSFVFSWDREAQKEFCMGYLAGDGDGGKNALAYSSSSQALAQGILVLLSQVYPDLDFTILASHLFRVRPIGLKGQASNRFEKERGKIHQKILGKGRETGWGEENPNFKNGRFAKTKSNCPEWFYHPTQYVYDIETESHSFLAGVGKILAHNSVHIDFRVKMNNHLRGWTIANAFEGQIKEPVDTLKEAEFYDKILLKEGKWRPDMDPTKHAFATSKASQPLIWLNQFNTVVPPGSVGATRFEEGVFTLLDWGHAYPGTLKPYFEEYFFGDEWKIFPKRRRFVFRALKAQKGWTKVPKEGLHVETWICKDDPDSNIPYILTRRARQKRDYVPEEGYSALPPWWEEKIPKEIRWWEKDLGEQARLKLIDQAFNYLIEKNELPFTPIKEDLEEAKQAKFILRFHWAKGQKVIRDMPSFFSHYDLVIDSGKDYLDEFESKKCPLYFDKVAGLRKICDEPPPGKKSFRDWMSFTGEIKPGEIGNPFKRISTYMNIIDSGKVNWIEDNPQFASFEFKGRRLKGYWVLKREAPDSDIWIFQKSSKPSEPRESKI